MFSQNITLCNPFLLNAALQAVRVFHCVTYLIKRAFIIIIFKRVSRFPYANESTTIYGAVTNQVLVYTWCTTEMSGGAILQTIYRVKLRTLTS